MSTNWTKFTGEAAAHITFENALTWDDSDEKFLWVSDHILDQIEWDAPKNGLRDMFINTAVNWIELRFQKLIEDNIERWADFHLAKAHAAGFDY